MTSSPVVGWLQDSPVCDAKLLAEVQRQNKLLEEMPRVPFGQTLPRARPLVLDDIIEHVPAARILHHNCQVLLREKYFSELHYVWVRHKQPVIQHLADHAPADACHQNRHPQVKRPSLCPACPAPYSPLQAGIVNVEQASTRGTRTAQQWQDSRGGRLCY